MSFKENILTNYNDILTASTAEDSPYQKAIDFIEENTDNGILDSKEKVEVIANMMSNIVTGITSQAMASALDMEKQSTVAESEKKLIDAQTETEKKKALEIESDTTNKNLLAQADLEIKDQQYISEKLKNGGIYYIYDYDDDGNLLSKTLQNGDTKSIHEAQKELLESQIITEDKKSLDIASNTSNKNILAQADLDIKGQQYISEKLKNGGVHYTYTYDDEGNIDTKTLVDGSTKSTYEIQRELLQKQIDKVGLDITLLGTQNNSLESQTVDNRILKSMDSLSEYIMGLGNAGLKPDKTFHTNLMLQQKAMMLRAGFAFEKVDEWNADTNNKYIVKDGEVEIGILDATPNATE